MQTSGSLRKLAIRIPYLNSYRALPLAKKPKIRARKPGPQGQSTIPPCGGQSSMPLPVKTASCFGVLEYCRKRNSKSQRLRFQVSVFRFQLLCFFFLTPDTLRLSAWSLGFHLRYFFILFYVPLTHERTNCACISVSGEERCEMGSF